MELSKNQINITKGIAILFMLLLHLFCTKSYEGVFQPLIMIGEVPLVYYIALFGDCCVAIYCFCSGYGLFLRYKNKKESYLRNNIIRLFKLYINYWIILLLFVVILGFIMGKSDIYPGDLKTFLLTFTAISPAYNGAWWFLTIYIILVLVSPIINKVVLKYSPWIIAVISLIIYFIGYIQRIKGIIVFDNIALDWIIRQFGLFGTSQFPFIIGAIFAEKKLYSKLYEIANKLKFKNLIGIILIVLMIASHGIVQTLFVAVFTGIVFICIFNLMDKPKWLDSLLSYLASHSTNMWLIHMFFYMIYFKELVFAPKYPILIFIWLVVLCIGGSYVINITYKPIIKFLDIKLKKNNY